MVQLSNGGESSIEIKWVDGTTSKIPCSYLKNFVLQPQNKSEYELPRIKLWDSTMKEFPISV